MYWYVGRWEGMGWRESMLRVTAGVDGCQTVVRQWKEERWGWRVEGDDELSPATVWKEVLGVPLYRGTAGEGVGVTFKIQLEMPFVSL